MSLAWGKNRRPKELFCAELAIGRRQQGGHRKRYKDTLKSTLKAYDIPVEKFARAGPGPLSMEGTQQFEESRLKKLDVKD